MFTTLLCLTLSIPAADPNSDFELLTKVGLEVPGLGKYKLPTPTLAEGMTPEQITDKVKSFVRERRYFLDRAPDAPYRLDRLKELSDPNGKSCGREINLWFAAHGTLQDLDDQDVLNALLGMKSKRARGKPARDVEYLDADALKKRGITLLPNKETEERYSILDAELVEKVKIEGVARSRKEKRGDSLISTMLLDPRFADDAEHPNRWRKILDDKETLGPPHPYTGFGGYVKATPLPGKTDILFIEMHFVFSEPHEWFRGRNLIGAWLPTATKENVKTLRRKLANKQRK